MVAGAYVAAGIWLIALITLLIMILLREVQDHASWKRIPRKRTVRAVRKGLSLRTPDASKLIVLITSGTDQPRSMSSKAGSDAEARASFSQWVS